MQEKDGPDDVDSDAISDCPSHSLQSRELNSSARTKFSITQDQDLPDDGDSIAVSDVPRVVVCLSSGDTQIVAGGKCSEIELSSCKPCSRDSIAQKSSPLSEQQGCGDFSEVKVGEANVSVEALCMIKMTATIEDAGIEEFTMSTDQSLKGS